MSDVDWIYSLFAEANPAPASATPTTQERPDAAVILRERRNPTMLTEEPRTIQPAGAPRLRRWRGPAIALASFVGVSLLGVASWLVISTDESDVADGTTVAPVATTLDPVATTQAPVVVPDVVSVPDVQGLALTDARRLLSELGLDVLALPSDIGTAIVVAQEPAPGAEVDKAALSLWMWQSPRPASRPCPMPPGQERSASRCCLSATATACIRLRELPAVVSFPNTVAKPSTASSGL